MAFAGSGNDVEITLTAYDNITPVLRGVSAGMGAFVGDADRMVNSLARIGAQAAPILAVGAALYYAGQQAGQVQQNVANLNAVLHATSDELAAIRQNGLALSQATQFTDAQILSAQRQLAKGGASAADLAMPGSQGITGAALDLASATGQRDPTKAATSLTTAMTAFQLNQRDAAGAATILAQAIDTSVGSLDTQATALRQSGVVARAAGLDLRATATDIAALQNAGLQSSAGTSLQTFLARVESPSMAARKAIADLNLEFYNLNGTLKTTPELFDEIRMKTMGMTQEQSQAKLFDIFGQRGIRVAEIAQEQGGGLLVEQAQRMSELGEASDIAARKMDTFQGSASKALSSINVLAVQTGTALVPAMKGAADEVLFLANGLSNLNNVAPIIPQMALAVGGIFGASRIAGGLNDRADTRAKEAADAARKEQDARFAAASQYSVGIAQAEFEADSKILSAHQQLTTQMQALDQKVFDQYIAGEEKVVAAMDAADAKRIASLQEVTAKTLASIDQIDAAYAMSAETQIQRQALTFEKQNAYLEIDQAAAQRRLTAQQASGSTPFTVQRATQEIERDTLAAKQVVDQEMLQRDLEIQQRASFAKRDAAIAGGEQQVQAIERSSQAVQDEILASANRTALANAEAASIEAASYRARYAETTAAAEAAYMNKVGGVVAPQNALDINQPGQRIAEGTIAAGMAGTNARSIAGNAQLAAGTVAVDEASFASKSRSAFVAAGSKITGLIGELILPLTIVAIAKPLVIDPAIQAIVGAFKDEKLPQIDVDLSKIVHISDDQGKSPISVYQDELKQLDDLQKQAQATIDNFHDPGRGGFSLGGIFKQEANQQDVETAKKNLDGIAAAKKRVDEEMALAPQVALGAANDEMATLIGKFKDGTITQAQMEAQWAAWGATVDETTNTLVSHDETLRRRGATAEQIIAVNKRFADSERDVADSIRKAKEEAEATYKDALEQAMQAQPLGVDDQTITRAYFGKNLDQSDVTKAQQQEALRDIAEQKKRVDEIKKAWTDAQSVVNQIDITKGISAFGGLHTKIDEANLALQKLGLQNAALQGLDEISASFAAISQAERQAEQALEGYNLTMNETKGFASQLTQIQSDLEKAYEGAEDRQLRGTASRADLQLISEYPTIKGTLQGQQQQLSQNLVLDVLGEVHNLPDFAKLDQYVRDTVEKSGGGIKVVATVEAETLAAKAAIDKILEPRTLDVTINLIPPNFSQFDPAIADRAKSWSQYYGNMGGYSPYDEPNRPPGGPPGGPPTGGVYAGLPPGTGVGVSQNWNVQGALAYKPVEYSQYADIVRAGGGKGGPLDSTTMYNAFISAMQAANVNPLAALSTLQMENNFGTNESRELQFENNFSGIKFANQPGATRGARSSENDNYAAFANPEDYFNALARNLSTGDYETPYQQGNFRAIRQRYVAGNAPPSGDQTANINNTVDLFNKWMQQFGWSTIGQSGYSSPSGQGIGLGGESGFDTSGGGAAGTAQIDQTAMNLRQRIVQTAMSQIDVNKLVAYCEQFVEETVQAATGRRGATGTNEGTASSAFADARSMGLVTKDPQPGDLVYYPDASGGTGHVAIYVGRNDSGVPMQVSTWDQGRMPSNVGPNHSDPNNAANARIHLEAVGAGAQYVNSLGQGGYTYGPGDPGNRGNAAGGTLLAQNPFYLTGGAGNQPNIPNIDASKTGLTELPKIFLDATAQAQKLQQILATMGGKDAQEVTTELGKWTNLFGQIDAQAMHAGNGPANVVEQAQAQRQGAQDALNLTVAWAAGVQLVYNHAKDVSSAFAAINAAAGPLGPMLDAQLTVMSQIDAATQKQKEDERALTDMQREQSDVVAKRAAADKQTQADRKAYDAAQALADRNATRADTRDEWRMQDRRASVQETWRIEKEGLKQQTDAENDAFTVKQRRWQDEQDAITRNGTLAMRTITDAQTAMERAQRDGIGRQKANEQVLSAQAANALSQGMANDPGIKLAISIQNDKLNLQDFQKQKDVIDDQIKAQQRKDQDAMYFIQEEQKAETRTHEDNLRNIQKRTQVESDAEQSAQRYWADQDKGIQRQRTQLQWQQEDARTQLQATRDKIDADTAHEREIQDAAYQSRLQQQQDVNKQDQQNLTDLNNSLQALGAIEGEWEKLYPIVGKSADALLNMADSILTKAGQASSIGDGAKGQASPIGDGAKGMPSQQVGGGAIRRLGYATGTQYAESGAHPVSEVEPEVVFKGGEQVQSLRSLMQTMLYFPSPNGGAGARGSTSTVNINMEGIPVLDRQAVAELKAHAARLVAESEARAAARASNSAIGAMR
jgi:TP901 family phage tail tape measure protein